MIHKSTRQPARKPTTIDGYLAIVKGEKRAALDQLRKTIGLLHFDPARPLPATLVRKLVKARIAEG
jgi:hypothetical protein